MSTTKATATPARICAALPTAPGLRPAAVVWMRFDPVQWVQEHPGMPPPHIEHGWLGYPTTAETLVPLAELQPVADYDDYLGVVIPRDADAAGTLRAWLGPVENDVLDLQATGSDFERRRRAT